MKNYKKDRSEIQNSSRLQKENEHDHRHDILDHDPVETLQAESPAAVLHFLDDPVGADHPADQDGGQHGNEGHHEAVADVVHKIQKLTDTAVGERKLHIELAVAQGDDNGSGGVEERQRNCGGLPLCVEDLHTVGRDGFQYGYTAGQRREGRHDKEGEPHEPAQIRHGGEDLGKGDEHQAGTRLHTLHALEDEDRGNDHHAGQKRHARVKKLNLMNGRVYIHILLNIRAVGDHNAHGHAQGEEDLAHGVQQDLQETLEGQSLEIGRQVYCQSLETCAGHARLIRVSKGQGEDGDRHDHDQHDGHQYFGTLLNTLFDAVKDNPGGQQHEDHCIEGRLGRGSYEIREEAVGRRQLVLPGQVDHDVTGDPAADNRIVCHDQHRDQKSQDSQKTPFGAHLGVGLDGVLPRPAAYRNVAGQQRKAEGEGQDQIDQDEETATVLGCQVGEAPEIADAHSAARGRHDKTDLAGETVFFVVMFRFSRQCKYLLPYI